MALPYWIEQLPNGTYRIWTKVSIAANSSAVLWLQRTDGYSPDGSKVFEFFGENIQLKGTIRDTGYAFTSNSFILEGKAKQLSDYSYSTLLIRVGEIDTLENVIAKWNGDFDYIQVYQNIYGNEINKVSLADVPVNVQEDFYFKVIAYPNGHIDSYYNNNVVSSDFDVDSYNYIGKTLKLDARYADVIFYYIFVRKYTENEPTVSVKQTEDTEDTWKITISNPNSYDLVDFQVAIEGIPLSSKTDSLLIDYTPPKEVKYIYILNTKTVDESGVLYDSIPSGYIIPKKQLVDESGNVYNYMIKNNTIYIEIPADNPILAQTLKTLSFNDVDYTQKTLDTSLAKWIDMVFSDVPVAVGGGDSSQILQHTISMDINTKFIKSTVVLSDGTTHFAYYDFSSEYDEIQNLVDISTQSEFNGDTIIFTATATNGKTATETIQLDENTIVNLYNSIMAKKYDSLKIRQGDIEYSFLIKNGHPNIELNIAKSRAIDGSLVYEQLGKAGKSYTYTIVVDTLEKKEFLENTLPNNPVFEVDIGSGYKQALLTDISIVPISPLLFYKYYADIEFIILE
jgi:hypothetical protein